MTAGTMRARALAIAAAAILVGVIGCAVEAPPADGVARVDAKPRIFPDYASTVIPPNLAPIRFLIAEQGAVFHTRIYGDHGTAIVLSRSDSSVPIPEAPWRRLVESNRGGALRFAITVKDRRGEWRRFEEFEVRVAPERVDDYLVYRRKLPGQHWRQTSIQIRQRALGGFDEKVVLDGARLETACLNCHAFVGNKTRFMALGFRSFLHGYGTLLVVDGKIEKLAMKAGYTAWHPSGDVLVFPQQSIPPRGSWVADSKLFYYRRATRTLREVPGLARDDWLQLGATFSADGRELFALAAPKPWGTTLLGDAPREVRRREVPYHLVRVGFDIQKDKWSEPEVVISSGQMGKNLATPKISLDGRWLSIRMMDKRAIYEGCIYLVDLEQARQTGRFEPRECPELRVGRATGWHSWSSNGRWLVFGSSRQTGMFYRPYLSYVDAEGQAHKPVLVPAKDPSAPGLDAFMYQLPELINGPVPVSARELAHVIRSSKFQEVREPDATGK